MIVHVGPRLDIQTEHIRNLYTIQPHVTDKLCIRLWTTEADMRICIRPLSDAGELIVFFLATESFLVTNLYCV